MAKRSDNRRKIAVAVVIGGLLLVIGVLSWRLQQAEARPDIVSVGICHGQTSDDRPPVDLYIQGE